MELEFLGRSYKKQAVSGRISNNLKGFEKSEVECCGSWLRCCRISDQSEMIREGR